LFHTDNVKKFTNVAIQTLRIQFHETVKGKQRRIVTELKFYKIMAIPALLYDCEAWTLTKCICFRIQAAEIEFLQSVAGYTFMDHRKNEDIRQ
jgi:hypothetical protein